MKKNVWIILLSIIGINTTYAQADNELYAAELFMAEVYLNITEGQIVYIIDEHGLPELMKSHKNFHYHFFCEKLSICDSTIVDELHDYVYSRRNDAVAWNTEAPVFQLPQYHNLIFSSKRDKTKKIKIPRNKNLIIIDVSKPVFTTDRLYALVEEFYKGSSNFVLYKNVDDKWVKVGVYKGRIS